MVRKIIYSLLIGTIVFTSIQSQAKDVDWPMYGLDYNHQRHSPLTQIKTNNVANLQSTWRVHTGVKASFQATPLVVDRVMYVSLPFNHVLALDAVTGKEIWRYQHQRKKDYRLCCGPANRGVAVSDGKVFVGTVDARLIALDARTGKVVWDIEVADGASASAESIQTLQDGDKLKNSSIAGQSGIGIAMAPIVYQGKVLVGITGVGYGLHLDSEREGAPLGAVVGFAGSYGRAGFLAAFDVKTGQRVWQFDTVAPQAWEGAFTTTTPDGVPLNRDIDLEKNNLHRYPDAAQYGGGSAWTTPTIDTKRGLLYFGTGNPSPQMDDTSRPGDNLYTISLVCLDIHTGKIRWHYQQVPHDLWGYDVASPAILFDYEVQGKKIPAVGQASKVGWYYIHDRVTGRLLKKSEAFIPQTNLFARPTPEGIVITPGAVGGVNWTPTALNPKTLTAFVPAIHWPVKYSKKTIPAKGDKPSLDYSTLELLMDEPRWGVLSAVDLKTGKMKWQVKTPEPLVGGLLSTASDLIFVGEGNGSLNAFDAKNGHRLWTTTLSAGVNAPPITYQIDGIQYIAVVAGGNQLFGFKQGDEIHVYSLPKK